ncbi:hypothetical protein EDB83DRAFT_2402597 [Lactarius deliciosus]|nr:hypothetical protein EDB83DRAFT_2402597 [Lactarius deliciosus]
MPAERTRSLKKEKEDTDGVQLTWTDTIESATASQQIAFAPAVTPGTFTEESFVDSTETTASLFPSTLDGTVPRKPGHGKKKAEDHIPRPPNAFILFRSSFIKSRHVSTEVETNHSTLSKIIGLTWQNMPHEERQFWHSKAKLAQAEHKRKFPDYAFRPSHVRSKGGAAAEKRKVREVGPKDMKRCAKIAQLLVEGKKGADLQAAVQEFDKNHVPVIVTRFDTPITARSFRRSVSEPAPDTDPSAPAFLRPDPMLSSRRLRATSSQPDMSHPSSAVEDLPACSPFSSWSSPPCSSVFGSSPFANIAESTDTLSDVWSDMPPLVLPPVSHIDDAFVSKQAPSLDFNTFVFHEAPVPCIDDSIDPLSPAPDNDSYGAFHAGTPVSFPPPLDMSFLDEAWSPSPFPSSPCTPINYPGGQFSPVEAVPAPPTSAYDPYNNIMAQLDSCGDIGFDCNQRPGAGLGGGDPLTHLSDLHQLEQQSPYPTSKGFSAPFQFFSHKHPAEVAAIDFTDMFASAQSFSF